MSHRPTAHPSDGQERQGPPEESMAGFAAIANREHEVFTSDSDRLADAFGRLTGPERQLLVCALAGNHPPSLAELRLPVLRGLAKARSRLTAEQRDEIRRGALAEVFRS